MMKVLVTGAGGFLGEVIVRKLLQQGDEVVGLARSRYPHLTALGVQMIQGDIADYAVVQKAVTGCDAVIHVAAKMGLCGSYNSFYQTNVTGTENIVRACLHHGVTKLVYTSTPSVVFDGKDEDGVNESIPYSHRFFCHYAKTKALAEQKILAANGSDIATVALRPHMIWGVGDPHLIARVLQKARAGRLCLIGYKDKMVDTIYVENAADAHLLALQHLHKGAVPAGKAYFLSNDEPITMAAALNKILAAAGLPPVKKRMPKSLAIFAGWLLEGIYFLLHIQQEPILTRYVAYELSTAHWFDISAAKKDLGYKPAVSIDEGLELLKRSLAKQGV